MNKLAQYISWEMTGIKRTNERWNQMRLRLCGILNNSRWNWFNPNSQWYQPEGSGNQYEQEFGRLRSVVFHSDEQTCAIPPMSIVVKRWRCACYMVGFKYFWLCWWLNPWMQHVYDALFLHPPQTATGKIWFDLHYFLVQRCAWHTVAWNKQRIQTNQRCCQRAFVREIAPILPRMLYK